MLEAAWPLLWPAVLAGLVAILVTVAIERLGGVVGGLLGTLPTTIVPFALGAWDGRADAFADTMGAVPAGMLLNALFLGLWRILPERLPPGWSFGARLAAMTMASLLAWLAAALVLVRVLDAVRAGGLPTLAVGLLTLLTMVSVGILATWRPRPAPRGTRRVGPVTLALRGALAGGAIAVAIALEETGGPLTSGVASVFPAIFVTTMVSLWLSQGEAVPAGAVGPMMLGSASVSGFALLAALTFPVLGPWLGAAAAWGLAVVVTTLPAFAWLRLRARTAPGG